MNEQRYIKCFGCFIDRPEAFVVEGVSSVIGEDHCPGKVKVVDGSFQFTGCGIRHLGRQCGECTVAVRVTRHDLTKRIV